jgi:anaerobic ribonucleoside-triphosphate reductase activating protein
MQELIKNHIVPVADVIVLIEKAVQTFNIEGVSFIGGEPFLQAKGLIEIAKWCKKNNLTTLSFSGYLYEELNSEKIEGSKELLSYLDILIDGEYREDERETERRWIGSKNQKLLHLTPAYNVGIEYESQNQSIEYNIYNSTIQINGWPFAEIINTNK